MIDVDGEVHRGWTQQYNGRKIFVGNGVTKMVCIQISQSANHYQFAE
jgi:hypothetical protein